ncbi:MAG: tetratricopeptide repeat protein [Caldithrix sp.]|nr:MAG: tetratricopeptide repeat protein [Caldithrix sp.]
MESNQSQPENVELLEGSQLLQQSNFKAAQESYKQTLEREPENLEAIYGLGIIYQYEEKYEEAKKYFERALNFYGENGAILNSFGVVAANLGDHESARDSFEKAVKIDPSFLDAQKNLAEIYITTKEYEKGIEAYQEILKHHHDDIESLLNVGRLYYEIGDVDSTRFILEKVLEIDSENKFAKNSLKKLADEEVVQA